MGWGPRSAGVWAGPARTGSDQGAPARQPALGHAGVLVLLGSDVGSTHTTHTWGVLRSVCFLPPLPGVSSRMKRVLQGPVSGSAFGVNPSCKIPSAKRFSWPLGHWVPTLSDSLTPPGSVPGPVERNLQL